jgi:hypothetical protein
MRHDERDVLSIAPDKQLLFPHERARSSRSLSRPSTDRTCLAEGLASGGANVHGLRNHRDLERRERVRKLVRRGARAL